MKKLLIMIFLSIPLASMAQNGWERVLTEKEKQEQIEKAEAAAKKAKKDAEKQAKKSKKTNKNGKDSASDNDIAEISTSTDSKDNGKKYKYSKYIQPGAVPEVDGKVIFTLELDVPGKNAQQIYDRMNNTLDGLAKKENQINSGILLVNKEEHIIAAKYSEWLEFTRNFFVLDRTEFNYTIIATCKDNHLTMNLERITYNYEEGRETGFMLPAEKLITDEYALNKKKTKLKPTFSKFRRNTIDRKDEIFQEVKDRLL